MSRLLQTRCAWVFSSCIYKAAVCNIPTFGSCHSIRRSDCEDGGSRLCRPIQDRVVLRGLPLN